MISPELALFTIISFLVIFGVILPIVDRIPSFSKFISFRWCLVVAFTSVLIGVIVDFSHLSDAVRLAVVIGVLVIGGIYILFRSLEKMMANGWSLGVTNIEVSKGDVRANIKMDEVSPSKPKRPSIIPQRPNRIPVGEVSTIKKMFGSPTVPDEVDFDPFESYCNETKRPQ